MRAENARQEFDRNVLWAGVKCDWRRIQSRPSKIPELERKDREEGEGEGEGEGGGRGNCRYHYDAPKLLLLSRPRPAYETTNGD